MENKVKYRSVTSTTLILILFVISTANSADAQDFCTGVRTGLQAAGEYFMPLRGAFDFENETYTAKVAFGEATDCHIEGDKADTNLYCQSDVGRDRNRAIATMRQYDSLLTACLGRDIRRSGRGGENYVFYRFLPTDDVIHVSIIGRSGNGSRPYRVRLTINYVDPRP